MDEFKNFLHMLGAFLAGLLTIIASVGAINAGGIYAVAGVLNFGWLYPVVKWAVNYVKQSHKSE